MHVTNGLGSPKTIALLRQSARAARTLLPQAENELRAAKARVDALRILAESAKPNPVETLLRNGPLSFREIQDRLVKGGVKMATSTIYGSLGAMKKRGRIVNKGGVWALSA